MIRYGQVRSCMVWLCIVRYCKARSVLARQGKEKFGKVWNILNQIMMRYGPSEVRFGRVKYGAVMLGLVRSSMARIRLGRR